MQNRMSALPPIADMCDAKRDVRFVPKADISQTKLLIQGHSKTGSQSAFEAEENNPPPTRTTRSRY